MAVVHLLYHLEKLNYGNVIDRAVLNCAEQLFKIDDEIVID